MTSLNPEAIKVTGNPSASAQMPASSSKTCPHITSLPSICRLFPADSLSHARRLRAHDAMQREKHEAALHNLEQAAGHCARAGGELTNLDAVADFIRSEIAGNFRFDAEVKDDPASWVSRAAAGLLLLGVPLCALDGNGQLRQHLFCGTHTWQVECAEN